MAQVSRLVPIRVPCPKRQGVAAYVIAEHGMGISAQKG